MLCAKVQNYVIPKEGYVGTTGNYLPCSRLYKCRGSCIFLERWMKLPPLDWRKLLRFNPSFSTTNILHSAADRITVRNCCFLIMEFQNISTPIPSALLDPQFLPVMSKSHIPIPQSLPIKPPMQHLDTPQEAFTCHHSIKNSMSFIQTTPA